MEIINNEIVGCQFTTIRVRRQDFGGSRVYLKSDIQSFERKMERIHFEYEHNWENISERNLEEIFFDTTVNREELNNMLQDESKISEYVAFYSEIEWNDFDELLQFSKSHDGFAVEFYKNSELPEYKILLTQEAQSELGNEKSIVYHELMRLLIDLDYNEVWEVLCDLEDKNMAGKVLVKYRPEVVEKILNKVPKRLGCAIEEQIKLAKDEKG